MADGLDTLRENLLMPFGNSTCNTLQDCEFTTALEFSKVSNALFVCLPLQTGDPISYCMCQPMISNGGEFCGDMPNTTIFGIVIEWICALIGLYFFGLFFFLSILREQHNTRAHLFALFAISQSVSSLLFALWSLAMTVYFFVEPGTIFPGVDFGVVQVQVLGPLALVLMIISIFLLLICWLQTTALPQHLWSESSVRAIQFIMGILSLGLIVALMFRIDFEREFAPDKELVYILFGCLSMAVFILLAGRHAVLRRIKQAQTEVLPYLHNQDAIERGNEIVKECARSIVYLSNTVVIGYLFYVLGNLLYVSVLNTNNLSLDGQIRMRRTFISGVVFTKIGGLQLRLSLLQNGRDAIYGTKHKRGYCEDLVKKAFVGDSDTSETARQIDTETKDSSVASAMVRRIDTTDK